MWHLVGLTWGAHSYIWPKSTNYPVRTTTVTLTSAINNPPTLVQWGRCCTCPGTNRKQKHDSWIDTVHVIYLPHSPWGCGIWHKAQNCPIPRNQHRAGVNIPPTLPLWWNKEGFLTVLEFLGSGMPHLSVFRPKSEIQLRHKMYFSHPKADTTLWSNPKCLDYLLASQR